LTDELHALRAVHQCVRLQVVQPSDRGFLSPDNGDWASYTTNARRLLRRVVDRAGIAPRDAPGRVIDIHALRHTAATGMARRGVPLVVAQRMLGHVSPEMTAKVHTHLGLEDLRGAVAVFGTRTRRVRELGA
jgi:integrase